VRKLEGKRPFGRFMHSWNDNIKIFLKKLDGVLRTGLVCFGTDVQWILVNTAVYL
jgi:hypothetical protein